MTQSESFSEREKQVSALLLQGKSNKQIALELGVSLRTVEFHLSRVYAKLGVTSRTEAVLKLSKAAFRESTDGELRESTVHEMDESDHNIGATISMWRTPVNKSFVTGLVLLIATSVFCMGSMYFQAKERAAVQEANSDSASLPTPTWIVTVETPIAPVSAKENILAQVRQLVVEYEQAVQAEKQNGDVEFRTDPDTGEEIFLFKGQSEQRIFELWTKLDQQIFQYYQLYTEVYRDEVNPTPFPTQSSPEENQAYYDYLTGQIQEYCPAKELDLNEATVIVYDPGEGKYRPWIINDEIARCDVYGKMMEEWRTAPLLAQVNRDVDMAMIRQVTGKPELILIFQAVQGTGNAPGRNAALYKDETGREYYVDIQTARLVEMIPNFPSHPSVPVNEKKSMEDLRGIARDFAFTNSPRLAELESLLLYEESCKNDICFFRWDYRNKNWAGTDWIMMPPFLQVGVLMDGQVVAYVNTLDLFE